MDNKKKARSLLLYLGIPILLIIIAAVFLSTRQSEPPKTSTLVKYFQEGKVESYAINYGSGAIEITLKEGEKAYPPETKTDEKSPTTQPALVDQEQTKSAKNSKGKVVVKGQLADIGRFIDDIKPYQAKATGDEAIGYNYIRASDNSLLMDLIPTFILIALFIGAWVFFMKRIGGGGLGGREMSFGKAKISVIKGFDEGNSLENFFLDQKQQDSQYTKQFFHHFSSSP